MNYAIEILQKELDKLNTPLSADEEEDDLAGAVASFRQRMEIKKAINILTIIQQNK